MTISTDDLQRELDRLRGETDTQPAPKAQHPLYAAIDYLDNIVKKPPSDALQAALAETEMRIGKNRAAIESCRITRKGLADMKAKLEAADIRESRREQEILQSLEADIRARSGIEARIVTMG